MPSITATFGTVEYRDGGVIAVPLNFAKDVIVPSKSICSITRVSGPDLTAVSVQIIGDDKFKKNGKGRACEVVFEVPPDRKGSFSVAITGTVLNASTRKWDTVTVAASTVTYDTRIPHIVNYDIPADYTVGEKFDVILQFDPAATFDDPVAAFNNTDATFLDFFIFEGADLGTPNLYRKTDNTFPTLPLPTELGTDWTQDNLQTEEATIYLLRWEAVQEGAVGVFNLTLKPGAVRGPVR